VSAPLLTIAGVSKSFAGTRVLEDISLAIADGEFLTILGESGSGKTTLLRIIAGFEQADNGTLTMQGTSLDLLPANRRNVNTVFQHYALFPHLTVFENIAYGLRAKRVSPSEIKTRVDATLAQMRMSEMSNRRPAQLSGGQQQRIALARALVNRPALLLLDEPLSALDASLRVHMQGELKALQRETGITFVFVTHDQEEAITMSDRIAVLRNGRLEQLATPRDLYNRPRTAYVATFIGKANLLPNGMAVRPENVQVVAPTSLPVTNGWQAWTGAVKRIVFAGASDLIEVECSHGLIINARVPSGGSYPPTVQLLVAPEHLIPLS
jgi:ABC-type Fe3+/spermidine/putrescine transport system ATPase subunit